MTPLMMAEARLEMLNSAVKGISPRVQARAMPPSARQIELTRPQARRIRMMSECESVALQAASILNANDIALRIDAVSRAELAEVIDAECRIFALKSRTYARPASGADAVRISLNIKEDQKRCMDQWLADMPLPIRQAMRFKDVPVLDEYIAPAIEKALDEAEYD